MTGVSSALGAAIAAKFVSEGAFVFGCGRTAPSWNKDHPLVSASTKGLYRFVQADLTSDERVHELGEIILKNAAGLDVIIHAAGGAPSRGTLSSLTTEEWMVAYDVNVLSLNRVLSRLSDTLAEGTSPSLIIIGSSTAEEPGAWDPHYSAAKAALLNFSKHLANRFAAAGVRVNYLALGPVLSGSWTSATDEISRLKAQMSERIPLARLGSPAEVAEIVWHLDSSAFSWVTGSQIRVDGGKSSAL